MIDLPPYKEKVRCKKCGYGGTPRTLYREDMVYTSIDLPPQQEHLQRICNRCGYTWKEAILEEEI